MPRSRRPPEPPEYFIDRNLGRHQLPTALQAAGRVVHTMLSVYGPDIEGTVPDETWLAEAGQKGWVVLTKDAAIRRRPAELRAIMQHRVRVVCITNQSLPGPRQVALIMTNINRIEQRAGKPGPWIYTLRERSPGRLWPPRNLRSGVTPRRGP